MSISLIIPTYNSMKTFPRCLESATHQASDFREIIVVDRFSQDGLVVHARANGATVIQSKANRSEARNIGLQKAVSDGVLFVDADMILPKTLAEECERGLKDNDALIVPEQSVGIGFWAECKAQERRFYIGDEKTEAARCFRRNVLVSLGGYRIGLEAGEDWDLQNRAIASRLTIGRVESVVLHDEGCPTLVSLVRKKYAYGKTIGAYLSKNQGQGVQQLNPFSRIVRPTLKVSLTNPLLGLGVFVLKTLEFGCAGVGYLLGSQERNALIK